MAKAPDLEAEIEIQRWRGGSGQNIVGVGYDVATRTFAVEFTDGSAYRYGDVSPEEAGPLLTDKPDPRLLGDESPGAYFRRQLVKQPNRHPYVRTAQGQRKPRAPRPAPSPEPEGEQIGFAFDAGRHG